MKVTLIRSTTRDGRTIRSLNFQQEYEVLGIEGNDYRIIDLNGTPVLFDPSCFVVTDPTKPEFWILREVEGELYGYPPGWGVPGFFEDWHDGVKLIKQVFSEQLSYWYPNVASEPK